MFLTAEKRQDFLWFAAYETTNTESSDVLWKCVYQLCGVGEH